MARCQLRTPDSQDAYLSVKNARPNSRTKKLAIHNLAQAVRDKILNRSGGGEGWLLKNGIASLISRDCLKLRHQSFGGLIDRLIPDIVNRNDPKALQPHELHHGLWQEKRYARTQLLRAFASYHPPLESVREYCSRKAERKDIDLSLRQAALAEAKAVKIGDLVKHGHLQSLRIRPPSFLSEKSTATAEDMANFCFNR
jgi:hypothetical protein